MTLLYAYTAVSVAALFLILLVAVLAMQKKQSRLLKKLSSTMDEKTSSLHSSFENNASKQTEQIQNTINESNLDLKLTIQTQSSRYTFFGNKKEEYYTELYKILSELELLLKEKTPDLEHVQKKWNFANRFFQLSELYLTNDMYAAIENSMKLYSQFIYQIEKDGSYYFPENELIQLMDLQASRYQVKEVILKETQAV